MPNENTTPAEKPFPYLNEYHKQHVESVMAERSKMPLRSSAEAYAQYDRLKAAAEKSSSAKRSTPASSATT